MTLISQKPVGVTVPDKLVGPSAEDVKSNQTERSPISPEPVVLLFSNNNCPETTVLAPAPKTGLSTGAGSVWLITESSVILINTGNTIPLWPTYPFFLCSITILA